MSDLPAGADEDAQPKVSDAAAQLRAAREAAGLSLKDIAETTRVPLRHLAALEEGDYAALPGMTYCAGFARSYARAVGLDEAAVVAQIREDIGEGSLGQGAYEFEEAVNPARIPPSRLAWISAIIIVLIAGAYTIWRMQLMTPPTDDQIVAQVPENVMAAGTAPVAAPSPATPAGPVILTAADDVWLRIYQPDGTRLFEGTLKRGESYTVPDNARDPMILTGRPDALAVTVGGQAVPPLGTAEKTISDVPLSPAALLARGAQAGPDDNAAAPEPGINASQPVTIAASPAPVRRRAKQLPADTVPAENAATP